MPQDPIALDERRLANLTHRLSERVIPALVTRKESYPRLVLSQNIDGGEESDPMPLHRRKPPANVSSSAHSAPTPSKRSTIGRDTKLACIYRSIDGLVLLTGHDI